MLVAGLCLAATVVTVSWTIPTKRVDGTALAASEIASYEILYSIDSGTIVTVPVAAGTTVSKAITLNLAPRATKYVLKLQMTAIDTGGRKSDRSAVVSTDIDVPITAPMAPINIMVSCAGGTCTATVVQQ
jgi:hypothetical protein